MIFWNGFARHEPLPAKVVRHAVAEDRVPGSLLASAQAGTEVKAACGAPVPAAYVRLFNFATTPDDGAFEVCSLCTRIVSDGIHPRGGK